MSRLSEDDRRRGVISASTGNHGQSIAFAARLFGVTAIICAPARANPVKVAAMEEMGAEVICLGADFDEARLHCEHLAQQEGYRYVHSANEPDLIAGVATHTLETLEARPDLDVIIVPVGGGSGAAGACIVADAIDPSIEVIGVPVESASLKGLDSLLSIVQMPGGVPVATMAIGKPGAVNAALLAARILAAGALPISRTCATIAPAMPVP